MYVPRRGDLVEVLKQQADHSLSPKRGLGLRL